MRQSLYALPFLLLACCADKAAPPSRFPTAGDALDRMHATFRACNAIKSQSGSFDDFSGSQRVRGELSIYAARPNRIRMDGFAPPPVNSQIAILTSDGERFAYFDMREKRFLVGPASDCNVQRLTKVPVPAHVMVEILMGQAPVLKHDNAQASIAWAGQGYYVVRVPGTNESLEEIHLVPRPEDFQKPWGEQRLRVLDVSVVQQGTTLYHVAMDDHATPPMDKPILPQIPGDPSVPLSGPFCDAEVPYKIKVEIPLKSEDVQFRYKEIFWNPPIQSDTFVQQAPPGMRPEHVVCQ